MAMATTPSTGYRPAPVRGGHGRASVPVKIAKRHVVSAAAETVDGASHVKRSPLKRAYRDVPAGMNHPFNPQQTLTSAGRLALSLPVDQVW